MKLVLSIVMCPAGCNMEGQQHQFGIEGGTFGRGPDNTWILPDPSRYVSTKHGEIQFENNQFKLLDCSTNGTYLNGGLEPLGAVNQPFLKAGDQLQFGDYRLQVSIEAAAADLTQAVGAAAPVASGSASEPANASVDDLDKWLEPAAPAAPPVAPQPSVDPLPVAPAENGLGIDLGVGDEQKDPLAALGLGDSPTPAATPNSNGALSDLVQETPPLDQQMMKVPNVIPDDWDDLLGGPAPASVSPGMNAAPSQNPLGQDSQSAEATQMGMPEPIASEQAPSITPAPAPEPEIARSADSMGLDELLATPSEEINAAPEVSPSPSPAPSSVNQNSAPSPQPAAQTGAHQASGHPSGNAASLAQALGLSLNPEQMQTLESAVADTVKTTVAGMMKTLRARSEVKSEFRMNMTTIQSAENNPLKFSVTPDDAIENMFAKTGKAYLSPVDAIEDGFADISDHQLALFDAMRAAYDNILNQFDPTNLEAKFENAKGKGILGGGKGKNWDLFKVMFDEYKSDNEAAFKRLFGEVFADAYERRMHSLKMNRKK